MKAFGDMRKALGVFTENGGLLLQGAPARSQGLMQKGGCIGRVLAHHVQQTAILGNDSILDRDIVE